MQSAPGSVSRRLVAAVVAPVVLSVIASAVGSCGVASGVFYDVAWTLSAAAAAAGSLLARSRSTGEKRLRWTLSTAACLSWLVGQIAWNVYGIVGFPPDPNVADVGWWGFAVLVMISMLRLPRGPRANQAVGALESGTLIAAAVTLCLGEYWSIATGSHLPLGTKISDLTYPVLFVSASILTLQAALGGALRGLRRTSVRLVLFGTNLNAFAFTLWCTLLLEGTYKPGSSWLDPLWVIGLCAIGIGGLLAAREAAELVEAERAVGDVAADEEPRRVGVLLPAAMFLALLGVLIAHRLLGGSSTPILILESGVFCSGAALVTRSALLGRRLGALLERERATSARLTEREAELARLNGRLLEDSRLDPLTGIRNRRALSDDLPMYQSQAREGGERIALALCDVDRFKAYNDALGHLSGDQALRMIAAVVRGAMRTADVAYRYGGEELLLVLRGVTEGEAVDIAERVRAAVEHCAYPHPASETSILTVSIGVAAGEGTIEELLARADAALYAAKRAGRNAIVAAPPPDGTGELVGRPREPATESPAPRHLRTMLAVSRAAASGDGVLPMLQTLADAIRSELSFHVVAVNLRERDPDLFRVVLVIGDHEASEVLLGTTQPPSDWDALLSAGIDIHGASWLPAGSYDWAHEGATWTPPSVAPIVSDAWQPEDMLLLPLRSSTGEVLAVLSVDQPVLGRRPTDEEIGVLMAVADHAGLALERIQRDADLTRDGDAALRLAAVMLLAETLDLRDPSTALHSRTVGQLARETASALGLPDARVERIRAAGILHDLGKLGIPDAILLKPGALDPTEWAEMRRHPEVGARILEHAGMSDIATWVIAHHERIDGRGYPAGLSGTDIPLEARILAVADSYEAMVGDRPYRLGMAPEAARAELRRCAGTQFDPEVVEAFLSGLPALENVPPGPILLETAGAA